MIARKFGFPSSLNEGLEAFLQEQGHSLSTSERLAPDVRKLSDYFTGIDGSRTPWELQLAYMVYYFPLNVARLQSVLSESMTAFPWETVTSILDFGSGPGTVHAALEATSLSAKPIHSIELDERAIAIHKKLGMKKWPVRWSTKLPTQIEPGTLGIFSYSLLEQPEVESRLADFEHLLIVTPSTREQGRKLLEVRREFIAKGFTSWAPCPHDVACPLLTQSAHDWCHDRIAFEAPEWFAKLESHLPFYNHTVTYSYWFASKTARPKRTSTSARIIGDTLFEKGKTRQAVCRGPNREFLSWLKKMGEVPIIPRGILVSIPEDSVIKGNEIRPAGPII
jgi:hypothetical protein